MHVRAADDRSRRLADERVADAGAQAVLWRHVLSARVEVGQARFHRYPSGNRSSLAGGPREGRAVGRRRHGAASRGRPRGSRPRPFRREAALANTVGQFRQAFDRQNGGFGDAPKFPRPSELLFLLREHARTGDESARDMVLRTLRRDGARRHARPRRRRLSPLFGGRRLARAAFREDAVRPGAARARVPRGVAGLRRARSISRWRRTRFGT